MYPVLQDSGAINQLRYGKGKLTEAISCVISEELNGDYSLELEYPVSGALYEELCKGGSLLCTGPIFNPNRSGTSTLDVLRGRLAFDIYKQDTPINGVVRFYAAHISRRLANSVFHGAVMQGSQNYPIDRHNWDNIITDSVPTDYDGITVYEGSTVGTSGLTNSFQIAAPKSTLAALIGSEESVAASIGGDIIWEFSRGATTGNNILRVDWYGRRGGDYGASVRFGNNMLDIQQVKDASGTYNAFVPYWDDGNGVKTYVSGYVVQPTTPITPIKAVPLDCKSVFETQPTEAQLTEYARSLLDSTMPWLGDEQLTVDFVNGVEYDPHAIPISLGDTVSVYWGDAQIAAKLRAVSYKYDVLAERYTEIKLGKQQENFVAVTGYDGGGSAGGGGANPPPTTPTWYYEEKSTTSNSRQYYRYTINGDGWIYAAVYIRSDATSDTGTSVCGVYHTPTATGEELARGWSSTRLQTAQAIEVGTEAVGIFNANNGDTMSIEVMCSKNGTKRIRYSIMCFGCTLTAQ